MEGRSCGLMGNYIGVCPEILTKITNNLSQENRCPGRDSTQAPHEHRSGSLTAASSSGDGGSSDRCHSCPCA
jgi:hypothetical protein